MAKLIFLLDGNVIKEYVIDKERMTIGRRATNDVHIDNLAISGEHAEIITNNDEVYIQDLNSTNGTVVNKKAIKKHILQHGDTIGLGKYQLKFVKDINGIKPEPNGFADTVLVTPNAKGDMEDNDEVDAVSDKSATSENQEQEDQQEEQSPTEQPVENPVDSTSPIEASQGPRLEILSGDNADGTLLLDKSMVKLGQPGKQVAVVTKRQEGYFITHVAGDQYPIVNGNSIGAQAYALNNHDEIEVFGTKMEFCLD